MKLATGNAAVPISKRVPFTTYGSLRGAFATVGNASQLGRLPDEWRAVWSDAVKSATNKHGDNPMFAVWSYGTPIAWHTVTDGWVVPDVRYSVTTSKHQGQARVAAANSPDSPYIKYVSERAGLTG